MKTKFLNMILVGAFMALGTTMMAQDSTMTKTNDNTMMSMDQQKPPRMMKMMDKNGDGMISMDEAKAAKNQKLYDSFKTADSSQDGMIDTKEFMAYQKTMKMDPMKKDEKMKMKSKKDSTDF